MTASKIAHAYRLCGDGWLPGWAGILLFLAAGAFVVWQLRREFAHVRPGALQHRVLPLIRLAVVGTGIWLLCRPTLVVHERWLEPPRVLLAVDRSPSMEVREEFGGLAAKIDALEALEGPVDPRRNRGCIALVRKIDAVRESAEVALGAMRRCLDNAATGLPPEPGFGRDLDQFSGALDAGVDGVEAAVAELPATPSDPEVRDKLKALSQQATLLISEARLLVRDAGMVKQEAGSHPDVLEKYVGGVEKLKARAEATMEEGTLLQERVDMLLLGKDVLARVRQRRVTRAQLAEAAAAKLKQALSGRCEPVIRAVPGLSAALADAADLGLAGTLSAVVCLSDGSAALDSRARETVSRIGGVPVHAVLAGRDGAVPEDAAVRAVEAPTVALRGQPFTCRVLLKNRLAPDQQPKLEVRGLGRVLATVDLPSNREDRVVCEVPVTIDQIGRASLSFEIRAAREDAFPGNEQDVAAVDVLAEPPRVLVVSGHVGADVGMYRALLDQIRWIEPAFIAADPAIAPIAAGTQSGEFPPGADDWKGISMALLLGEVPEGLSEAAVSGLKTAVERGLRVLVQDVRPGVAGRTWASALGLSTRAVSASGPIEPVPGIWPELFDLDADRAGSMARLRSLPRVGPAAVCATPGIELLRCDAGAVVTLIPQGRGLIVYTGIVEPSSLRASGQAANVNRLLINLVTTALRPWEEAVAAGRPPLFVFPPQPVAGKRLILGGVAAEVNGLERIAGPAAPWSTYEVLNEAEVAVRAGDVKIARAIRRLKDAAEFDLTARSAPLLELTRLTGGTLHSLVDLSRVPAAVGQSAPVEFRRERAFRLWDGWWPLALLLALVSTEYLLRRRAGRVM